MRPYSLATKLLWNSIAIILGSGTIFVGEAIAMSERIPARTTTALFQELRFSVPTDIFFTIEFDSKSGEMYKMKRLVYAEVLSFGETLPVHHAQDLQGIRISSNDRYGLFLCRKSDSKDNSYEVVLIDLKFGEVVQKLPWGVFDSMRNQLVELKQGTVMVTNLHTNTREQVRSANVTGYAVDPNDGALWLLDTKGTIKKSTDTTEVIKGRLRGLLTDADFISPAWLCFYNRLSEKTTGDLYFLSVPSGKVKKANKRLPQCRLIKIVQ